MLPCTHTAATWSYTLTHRPPPMFPRDRTHTRAAKHSGTVLIPWHKVLCGNPGVGDDHMTTCTTRQRFLQLGVCVTLPLVTRHAHTSLHPIPDVISLKVSLAASRCGGHQPMLGPLARACAVLVTPVPLKSLRTRHVHPLAPMCEVVCCLAHTQLPHGVTR